MKLGLTQETGKKLLNFLRKQESPTKLIFESKSDKIEIKVVIEGFDIGFPPNKRDLASIDLNVIELIG